MNQRAKLPVSLPQLAENLLRSTPPKISDQDRFMLRLVEFNQPVDHEWGQQECFGLIMNGLIGEVQGGLGLTERGYRALEEVNND